MPNNYGWFKASSDSEILFKLPEKKGLRFDERLDVAKAAYRFRRFRLVSRLKKRFDQELRELNTRRSIIDAIVRDIDSIHDGPFESFGTIAVAVPTSFPTILTARNPINYTQLCRYQPDGYASDTALTYHCADPTTRVVGDRRIHVPPTYAYHRPLGSVIGRYGLEDFTPH